MKYVIILSLALLSCKKEQKHCNCGLIESDNVTDYSIIVRNDCSQNSKKFYLTQGDWMNAPAGSNHCFTNVDSW